jgi:hypothetical protein
MLTIKKFYFSLLALVLAVTACGAAQSDNIQGNLTQDNIPAVGIAVKLGTNETTEGKTETAPTNFTSQEVKTDDKGHFAFRNVPPGRYTITIVVKEESRNMNCVYIKYVTVKANERMTVDVEIPKRNPPGMGISPSGDLEYSIICAP